ncbi:MAG: GNAT family N-acetyltransferase [Acidobacteria bacterium]|nr:GNAT family N-acetyltransferase [Acidobacteriota bacterium]MBI3425618.1 GNAT family N-acetyltransferase [Acidobacteriota bacterium]
MQNNTPPTIKFSPEFTRDFLLRDGALLRVRALRVEDRDKLRALYDRCSPETLRYRFLYSIKTLSDTMLDRLINVDGAQNLALVITMGENNDERIVAVGRYQTIEERPEVAEVSFLVEDALQRRGIGTQLLDTLAELARLHGLTRFAADVLTDNRLMLSVFRKAGYGLSGSTSYGVTHLEFPIAQTELMRARAEAQEAEAERASLRAVLAPQSIAVIGASRNQKSVGGALFRNLVRWGFQGVIYPVNPTAKSVAGVRAYASIAAVPEIPELAFITVPAQAVLEAARQCAAVGVRALCVLSAGFAEAGPDGKTAQAELLSICRASGMRLVGPNCLGMVNAAGNVRMLGTFAPMEPSEGNLAMSSQSGALGLALINQAKEYGLGISSFVSTGNKADVSGNDLLQYWEADEATDVILLYLESFGNPRRFAPIARRVARSKPIVAVKSGRTAAGAQAASSHTAALASSDRAADALFAQTGIIRVDTLHEFFAVARLLAQQPIPAGNRVGILTNAGGPAILAVDAAEAAGLKVPTLSAATQAKLRAVLPAAASVNNPVDMIASATPEHYRDCLDALCDEPDLDALLVIFIPPLVTPSTEVAQVISEVVSQRATQLKPIVAVFLDPAANLTAIQAGTRKVPVFNFPESAMVALGAAASYGTWRAQPAGKLVPTELDRASLEEVLQRNGAGWLPSPEAAQLLRAAGIESLNAVTVRSAAAAQTAAQQLGRPVSLKIVEPAILHKSDVGGVLLNIPPSEAAAAYERLAAQLAERGISLQAASLMPMAQPGVEVLAGITTDPVFGPLVAFGSGGVLVELLNDIVFRVLPLTDRDAAAMIHETRAARLLKGYRGTPPADIAALEQVLLKLGALAESTPRIAEIDLNPVIVHPTGQGLSLIDARVRLLAQ